MVCTMFIVMIKEVIFKQNQTKPFLSRIENIDIIRMKRKHHVPTNCPLLYTKCNKNARIPIVHEVAFVVNQSTTGKL